MRKMIVSLTAAVLLAPGFAQAMDCSSNMAQPLRPATLAPIASELSLADSTLGAPSGVLSQTANASQSVDQVLLRIRIDSCQMANISPVDTGAYKPRTEFDNTPWRFNMSQNGKNMTADEFSAWMQSKGVHVARGAAPAPVESVTLPAPGTLPAMQSPTPTPTPAPAPSP